MSHRLLGEQSGIGDRTGRPQPQRRRRRPRALIALAAAVVIVSAATARLFVWPDEGMPAQVSAIVMLDGPSDPLSVAVRLAREHRAPFLVVSRGTSESGDPCPPADTSSETDLLSPRTRHDPGRGRVCRSTGQEVSLAFHCSGRDHPSGLARRLRVERCFAAPVYVVTSPIMLTSWPYEMAYEWGVMTKALAFQRGC